MLASASISLRGYKVKLICKMLITFIIIEVCTCSGSMAANKWNETNPRYGSA